jgi:hypothetical protein
VWRAPGLRTTMVLLLQPSPHPLKNCLSFPRAEPLLFRQHQNTTPMLHAAKLARLPAVRIHDDKRTNRFQASQLARVDVPARRVETPSFEKVQGCQNQKDQDLSCILASPSSSHTAGTLTYADIRSDKVIDSCRWNERSPALENDHQSAKYQSVQSAKPLEMGSVRIAFCGSSVSVSHLRLDVEFLVLLAACDRVNSAVVPVSGEISLS